MDRSSREVVAILEALSNMLIISKERLKPFIDEGFVHTDRQLKQGGLTTCKIEAGDGNTFMKIREYKMKFCNCMEKAKVHEIENMLFEISDMKDTMENNKVYQEL